MKPLAMEESSRDASEMRNHAFPGLHVHAVTCVDNVADVIEEFGRKRRQAVSREERKENRILRGFREEEGT